VAITWVSPALLTYEGHFVSADGPVAAEFQRRLDAHEGLEVTIITSKADRFTALISRRPGGGVEVEYWLSGDGFRRDEDREFHLASALSHLTRIHEYFEGKATQPGFEPEFRASKMILERIRLPGYSVEEVVSLVDEVERRDHHNGTMWIELRNQLSHFLSYDNEGVKVALDVRSRRLLVRRD
jgi:hypothetical protein